MNIEQYLNDGMDILVKDIMRATLKNPKESAFFVSYGLCTKRAEKTRHKFEMQGEHIPSFLIASITGECNLKCSGCYDRANTSCHKSQEMNRKEWANIFTQAEDVGVSAILLAGGEPLVRADVIEEAANHPALLFPVFTNGTMLNTQYLLQFEQNRNLIPIISIEGDEAQTDARRGAGIYSQTIQVMQNLNDYGLLFGVSITVTSKNLQTVTNDDFIADLHQKGCKAIVFVEYVPVENRELSLNDAERDMLDKRVNELRGTKNLIIISFPGDEKQSGGCLAAGRGFFHINASGGAEPCPFSPYSDTSLRNVSLREALKSPLFARLQSDGVLLAEHVGGCALFEQSELVMALVNSKNSYRGLTQNDTL